MSFAKNPCFPMSIFVHSSADDDIVLMIKIWALKISNKWELLYKEWKKVSSLNRQPTIILKISWDFSSSFSISTFWQISILNYWFLI